MIDLPSVGTGELNTILLAVGIPVVSYIGRKLLKAVEHLNETVAQLHTVLLGTAGQGGLVRRVESLAERAHENANDLAVLKAKDELRSE